nr:superoxide dismutase family protein [Sphingobium sp. CFD-2]
MLLRLSATGLTPGWHAMHFHDVGDCSDAGFQRSGGHLNHSEQKKSHGLLSPKGPDFGDLPNIFVAGDGSVKAEAFSALVKLGTDSKRADLLDADGSALVIHAHGDDHATQPIGGAAGRVACAVVKARR